MANSILDIKLMCKKLGLVLLGLDYKSNIVEVIEEGHVRSIPLQQLEQRYLAEK